MDRLNNNEQVVNVETTKALLQVAQLVAQQTNAKQLNIVKEWLYQGAEGAVIQLLEQGKITYSLAAEALDITIYDIQELLEARGIRLGPSEDEERYIVTEHYPKKRV